MKPGTVARLTLKGGGTTRAFCVHGSGGEAPYWVCENGDAYDLNEPGVKVETLTVFDQQKFNIMSMSVDELNDLASTLAQVVSMFKKKQTVWDTVCDLIGTVLPDPEPEPAPRFKEPGIGGIVKCGGWVYMKHMDGYWYNQQTDETLSWADIADIVDAVISEGVHTV